MMERRKVTLVWGEQGLRFCGPHNVCVIVDVLSFSTAVVAACAAGVLVYPFGGKGEDAKAFAESIPAKVAVQRQDSASGSPSLSPHSLSALVRGTRLVLPSLNGSALSTLAVAPVLVCGCLRNARAVARYIDHQTSGDVVVVAAGERWPDRSLRPALEDMLGAGAIIADLSCDLDVEAQAAKALYRAFSSNLATIVEQTMSAEELILRNFREDVEFAMEVNASSCVPRLRGGVYASHNGTD